MDVPKPLKGFEVEGRLAYLHPEQGKLQAIPDSVGVMYVGSSFGMI